MHKLLLADDSVTIQRVIELTFSGEDIQVIAVNDGEQAIARIPAELPDIVLADIGMPKKGGYDVAAFVKGRSELEHIPVLLLAGAFEPVDQARAEQVRCDGVLIKPFEPRQVIERVRELLEGVKGSPALAIADVPRPVERLSPRPELQPVPSAPMVAAPAPAVAPAPQPVSAPEFVPHVEVASPVVAAVASTPVPETDPALDDYFESLNAVFEGVGPAVLPVPRTDGGTPRASDAPAAADAGPRTAAFDAPRRRGDSLDDYFDRLSTAFEQAKPVEPLHPLADGFEELVEERHVPTVEALVGGHTASENGNGAGRPVNGHDAPRNPIVDALEAMLGRTEPVLSQPTLPGLPEVQTKPNGVVSAGQGDDSLADAVTGRVLDRLLPEITATVQRLVREEIERLRH